MGFWGVCDGPEERLRTMVPGHLTMAPLAPLSRAVGALQSLDSGEHSYCGAGVGANILWDY